MSTVTRLSVILAAVSAISLLMEPIAYASDHCIVTIENRSPWQVTMYIDGHYGCTANAGMDCSSTENQDAHHLEARMDGKTVQSVDSPAGQPEIAWRVCREGDDACRTR